MSMVGLSFAYPFVDYFTATGPSTAALAAINLGFIFGIPLIGVILMIVRVLYKSRLSVPARVGLNLIWVINIISFFALAAYTGRQFQQSNQIPNNSELNYFGDTLHLELTGEHRHDRLQLGSLALGENQLLSDDIRVNIRPSESDVFEIRQEHLARGASIKDARALAEVIHFTPTLNDKTLALPREFAIPKGTKWRAQKVLITVFVPQGKFVSLGKGTRGYIGHFSTNRNVVNPWPYDKRTWRMEPEGLICPDYIEQHNRNSQLDYRDFSQLIIEGKMKVTIEQGDHYDLRLTGKEVYTKKVDVIKLDETLTISTELKRTNSPIRLHIVMPQLQAITLENTDDVKIQGFSEKHLAIKNRGRGDIKAYINVDSLSIRQSGSHEVDVRGKGHYLHATIADRAKLDAEHFTVDRAEYRAEGHSDGKLAVTQTVHRHISNGCRLEIDGEPEIIALEDSSSEQD